MKNQSSRYSNHEYHYTTESRSNYPPAVSDHWKNAIQSNDIKKLKQMKYDQCIPMKLSNDELIRYIKEFNSVEYYETFEFLLDNYIILNDKIADDFIIRVLWYLGIPNNKQQQNSQLQISKKLIKYQSVKNWMTYYFDDVVRTLNTELVDCFIEELNIMDINELFHGWNVLNLVVVYLINNPNIHNEFAFEMFDHLLLIGANVYKIDLWKRDITFYINKISELNIKNKLNEMIENHKPSKY